MLIKEIYIENFGKLSGVKMSFGGGLNSLCRENGFGKTTLSVFIKVMLYGFDEGRSHSLLENERKRYTPWQGGAFGGYMIFSDGEREYRIERSFGAKPSDDKAMFYDNKTSSPLTFSERSFGEEIFGIDAQGFERTLFLSEKNLSGGGKNPTISAKLSDLSGVEGDIGDFDSAIKLLDDRRKFYRLKGGRGAIQDTEAEAIALQDKLAALDSERKNHKEYLLKIAELTEELEKIQAKKQMLLKKRSLGLSQRASSLYRSQYKDMETKLADTLKKEKLLLEFFSKKLPTFPELSEISAKIRELEQLKGAVLADGGEAVKVPCPFAEVPTEAEIEKYREFHRPEAKAKRCGIYLALAFLSLILGIALGALVAYPLFAICALSAIFLLAFIFIKKAAPYNGGAEAGFYSEREEFIKRIYGAGGAAGLTIEKMAAELAEYKSSLAAAEGYASVMERKATKARAKIDFLLLEITAFLSCFPTVSADPIGEITEHLAEYEFTKRQRIQKEGELSEFATAHDLNSEETEAIVSISEVEEEIAAADKQSLDLSRERMLLEGYAKDTARRLELCPEIEAKLGEVKDRLDKYRESYEVILKTQELLGRAKTNMTARYLGAAKAAFDNYVSKIGDAGEFFLDTDFSVSRRDMGLTRPSEAYSLGTRELYSLCVRLALNDALYEGKKPPVILDDPFSSFDDKRIKEALAVLGELARDRQIIYMTCSKSRNA